MLAGTCVLTIGGGATGNWLELGDEMAGISPWFEAVLVAVTTFCVDGAAGAVGVS